VVVLVSENFQSPPTITLRREFARVIAPLERASGRRLGNPAREDCLRAFEKCSDGVQELAHSVLADAKRNALGLFVYRIRYGWHELEPVPDRSPSRGQFVLQVDRDDVVTHEMFSDLESYERRAAELERELGAHNVTRLAP
jgi:hypothetical protein